MACPRKRREAGFTYLGLVILLTIVGLVGAATLKVDSLLRRAAAEEELLETGAAFSAALQSYAAATPPGRPTQPPTLQDLLKDPRVPGLRRHLRKIFVDPVTGKGEWGVVYQGEQAGVLAVYSLSGARPLKLANFDARFQNFENKEHISDWKFTANGQGVARPDRLAPAAPQPASVPPVGPPKPAEAAESRDPADGPEPPSRPEPPEPDTTAGDDSARPADRTDG
ncbi:MAG: type II secretion system protein [Massilia sp.]